MKKYITEVIVLRNINYRDSNKIYTLLSRDQGKISAMARGVRKISSKRAGNLDTLNVVSVSITEDSKGFRSIDEAKSVRSFKEIKNSLKLIAASLNMIELVNIFLDDAQYIEGIYELLLSSLTKLSSSEEKYSELITIEFELRLMSLLGYELTFDRCVSCGKIMDLTWESYWFSYNFGGISCENCKAGSFQLEQSSAQLLKELAAGSFATVIKRDLLNYSKVVDLVKNHVETTAINYYRKPKVRKMLYT